MTRNIHSWTYRDVTQFLKDHDFNYYEPQHGSHQLWIKLAEDGTPDRIVEVHFTYKLYRPKVLRAMITQSGIAESEWMAWSDA